MSACITPILLFALVSGRATQSWRPPELEVDATRRASFEEIKDIAFSYLDRPYAMGGVGNPAFDCSGLVCRVFAEGGYALPRVSRDQARAGTEVERAELRPGDLVFFSSSRSSRRITHVGVYLGDGEMIHASTGRGRVAVSSIRRGWFADRFVTARRVLSASGAPPTVRVDRTGTSSVSPEPVVVRELVEHTGADELPLMLRLPKMLPEPRLGFELSPASEATGVGVTTAAVSEDGRMGFVVAPSLALVMESIALDIQAALPIRFDPEEGATIGTFEEAADGLRILRHASLGLRGADFELALTRFGDFSLGQGVLLSRLVPHSAARAVPGLSVERTPLSLFLGFRDRQVLGVEVLADDVTAPGVVGASVFGHFLGEVVTPGVTFVTDQRAERVTAERRAISSAEASLAVSAYEDGAWSLNMTVLGAAQRSLGEMGAGAFGQTAVEHRFAADRALTVGLELGYLGPSFLAAPFGPTYYAGRSAHMAALQHPDSRLGLGGTLSLRLGRFVAFGGLADALAGRHSYDRRVFAGVQMRDLALWDWFVDLKAGYAARGFLDEPSALDPVDVFSASAAVRLTSWATISAYLLENEGFEGGLGLTVVWAP